MPQNKVRQLTYGAMMAVLFTVLMLLSNVPLLTIITTWFIPLPIALYASKFDIKNSIVVSIVGSFLVFLVAGLLSGFMALFFAIIGMTMSANIKRQRSKMETFIAVSTASLIMIAGTVYAYILFTGVNIVTQSVDVLKKAIYENYEASKKLADSLGQKPIMTKEQADLMVKTITDVLPATAILSAFAIGLIIILVNFPIMKKLGVPVQKFNALKDLRLPRILLLGYLIIIGIQFIAHPESGTYLYAVYMNANLILTVLFFVQGLSFIHFMIARSKMPKAVAWIATILAFPLSSFVVLLGIVDLGFDLRTFLGDKTKK